VIKMKNIQKIRNSLGRSIYASVAALMLMVVILAIPLTASAAQLSTRSITMSDSGPSGGSITSGVGSGTNAAYKVGFTVASGTTVGGIVIDFCSNSALQFDTCTAPTAFNANSATIQIYNQTNLGAGAFAVYTTTPVNDRIIITRATAALPAASSTFELGNGTTNGFTNPSTTASFYARIYTYDTAAHAQAHSQTASTGGELDFGGIALTTNNVVTITARVQEQLTFCMSGVNPGPSCGTSGAAVTSPALTLGHGTTPIITNTAIDSGTVYSQVNTNAGSGAIVRMHDSNVDGGLDSSGGGSIPPANAGSATEAAQVAGAAFFGLYVAASSFGTGGSGTVTPSATYGNATANYYGMDSTTSGSNVTTTYGGTVESCTGPVNYVSNAWTFAATASPTTPAGLYTANLAVIATGTF
jgi:hypothetical protein